MNNTITLPLRPPFNANALFDRLVQASNRASLIRAEAEQRRITRVLRLHGGAACPAVIEFTGTVDLPSATLFLPNGLSEDQVSEAVRQISHMICADVDLSAFYAHFSGNEPFERLFAALHGSKLLLDPDPFECLVKTIISQQLNLSFAGTLIERLALLAGEAVLVDGSPMLTFPDANAIARLTPEELRPLAFSQRKAEYVIDAARAVVNGTLDWGRVERMNDDEVIAELTRLRGIGRWTVECLLIFSYGRPNLLPAADIGLRNAVRRMNGFDAQPTADEVARIAEGWSPWRTYATYYLWESLRLP